MAYRGDDGDAHEAPTAEGPLRLEVAPRVVKFSLGSRSVQIAGRQATVVEERGKKPATFPVEGRVFVARGFPREDLGVWIELGDAVRRIFGVAPVDLLVPDGLRSLSRLDVLAGRARTAVGELWHEPFAARAFEIGSGEDLDKVLIADLGDRFVVYARRLFRHQARKTMTVLRDGRIILEDGKELVVTSRFGITVRGDYVRFADADGNDLARVSIPWIAPEDRDELARRLGQLVDRTHEPAH